MVSAASASSAMLTILTSSLARLPAGVGVGAALLVAGALLLAVLLADVLLGAALLELALEDGDGVGVGAAEALLEDCTLEELRALLVLVLGGGGGGVEVEVGGGGGGGVVEDGGGGGGADDGGGAPPPTDQVAPKTMESPKPKRFARAGVQSKPPYGQPGHWARERSARRVRG